MSKNNFPPKYCICKKFQSVTILCFKFQWHFIDFVNKTRKQLHLYKIHLLSTFYCIASHLCFALRQKFNYFLLKATCLVNVFIVLYVLVHKRCDRRYKMYLIYLVYRVYLLTCFYNMSTDFLFTKLYTSNVMQYEHCKCHCCQTILKVSVIESPTS